MGTNSIKKNTNVCHETSGSNPQVTGCWSQVTGCRSKVMGHRSRVGSQATGRGSQVTGHRSQVMGHRLQLTNLIIISCSARGKNKTCIICSKTVSLITLTLTLNIKLFSSNKQFLSFTCNSFVLHLKV